MKLKQPIATLRPSEMTMAGACKKRTARKAARKCKTTKRKNTKRKNTAKKAKKPATDTKPTGTRQPIVPLNTPATFRDLPPVQMSPKELAEATGLTQKTILALDGCCLKINAQRRPGIRFIYISGRTSPSRQKRMS